MKTQKSIFLLLSLFIMVMLFLSPQITNANLVPDNFNPDVNKFIQAVAIQSDGKILIGGDFSIVNGTIKEKIARLNADGTLDGSFNADVDYTVYAIAIQSDGKILIAGEGYRNTIVRLNKNGTIDTTFDVDYQKIWSVQSIAIQSDGKIIVGGSFYKVVGEDINHLARLNSNGTIDESFNADVDDVVYAIAIQSDGKILIGGDFSIVNGTIKEYIARLNYNGTLDGSFNLNLGPQSGYRVMEDIAIQSDGKILIAGTNCYGSISKTLCYLARFNTDNTVDESFNHSVNSNVYSIAVQLDGKILIGGFFSYIGAIERQYIARLYEVTDQFYLNDQTEVATNTTVTSNTITVSGISSSATISITGGTYSINGGAYTSANGTVNNGNAVTVQLVSSESYSTTTEATLTIGGVSDTFSVTTKSKPKSSGGGGGGGGCFIATAAFGSPLAKQVEILRQFRDRYLLTNTLGKKFVTWYYRNGPIAANWIKDKPLAKVVVQTALYPLIGFSFLLISGYLPFIVLGLLLSMLLLLRFKQKELRV